MEAKPIYKYFRFDDNLKSSLNESFLWFSNCDNLNDPFEFKLYTDDNLSDIEIIEYYKLMRQLDKGRIDRILNQNIEAFIFAYRNFPDQFVEYFLLPFQKKVRDFGICCFSEKYDDVLMWSHYANSHKGIVLEFNENKLDKSILLANSKVNMTVIDKIKYSSTCPLIKISGDLQATSDSIKDIVYTKSESWKYESEVRIISNTTGRHYFDLSCINSIYLGTRFEEENLLFSILEKKGIKEKIEVYKMREKTKGYGLECGKRQCY